MNQSTSTILRKFAKSSNFNYKRLKKLFKTYDWKKKTWMLEDMKKSLNLR